jgi:hypothetical protein
MIRKRREIFAANLRSLRRAGAFVRAKIFHL